MLTGVPIGLIGVVTGLIGVVTGLTGYGKVKSGITKAANLKLKPLKLKPLVERLLSGGLGGRLLRHAQEAGNPGKLVIRRDDFYEWLQTVDVLQGAVSEALPGGTDGSAGMPELASERAQLEM